MNPLESLTAAAARLVQEGRTERGALGVRLCETAATIRCSVAAIQAIIQADASPAGKRVRQRLVMGGEDMP
jgi:hypothetical protein